MAIDVERAHVVREHRVRRPLAQLVEDCVHAAFLDAEGQVRAGAEGGRGFTAPVIQQGHLVTAVAQLADHRQR